MSMSREHREDLRYAKALLENVSLVAKITNVVGKPFEKGFERLPVKWSDMVNDATRKALERSLHFAVMTMDDRPGVSSSDWIHKMIVAGTGGVGGAFGLLGLAVELPVSTTVMLRSIADIARSEGERVGLPEGKVACLEVFALGGGSGGDDASETGYFAIRAALARAISEATQHIAERGLVRESAPVIVRLIDQIASRFGVMVSEKAAAQAVPAIGALGGALVNVLFVNHFQDMARGHFTVRRLERSYGSGVVKEEYEELAVIPEKPSNREASGQEERKLDLALSLRLPEAAREGVELEEIMQDIGDRAKASGVDRGEVGRPAQR